MLAIAKKLLSSVKPDLKGKNYLGFRDFIASEEYRGLFVGLPQRAAALAGDLRESLGMIGTILDAELDRAKRSHRYFQYVFECDTGRRTDEPAAVGARTDAVKTAPVCDTLRVQYRMHPAIRYAVSRLFYEETPIEDPFAELPSARSQWLSEKQHPLGGDLAGIHLAWTDVRGRMATVRDTTTKYNRAEAEWVVLRFLPALTAVLERQAFLKTFRIVILSGYRGQVEYLDGRLQLPGADRLRSEVEALRLRGLQVRFETVDSFQGQDADIVLVSMVATSRRHFWRDTAPEEGNPEDEGWSRSDARVAEAQNRLNVLLSRAKRLLIVVGDAQALSATSTVARRLLSLLQGSEISPYLAHYRVLDGNAPVVLGGSAVEAGT